MTKHDVDVFAQLCAPVREVPEPLVIGKRAADVNHNPRDYDFGSRAFEESRAQK